MNKVITILVLLFGLSCGSPHCDGCVDARSTVTFNGELENISGVAPNIIAESNTYFSFLIHHSESTWNSAHVKMYNKNAILLDSNQNIKFDTGRSAIATANDIYSTVISFSIDLIKQDGVIPLGEIFFEGTLTSDQGSVTLFSSLYSYKCEDIIEDFNATDCRFSCQIDLHGFDISHSCNSQLCPI